MIKLIRHGLPAQDDSAGSATLPLADWLAQTPPPPPHSHTHQPQPPHRPGLELAPDDELTRLLPHLPQLALICIRFPRFTDGRGYSLARLLRRRHGYTGELRARGDVLLDQLPALLRCGFDAFELRPDQDLDEACKQVQQHAAKTP